MISYGQTINFNTSSWCLIQAICSFCTIITTFKTWVLSESSNNYVHEDNEILFLESDIVASWISWLLYSLARPIMAEACVVFFAFLIKLRALSLLLLLFPSRLSQSQGSPGTNKCQQ